jgi:hypothetical protein
VATKAELVKLRHVAVDEAESRNVSKHHSMSYWRNRFAEADTLANVRSSRGWDKLATRQLYFTKL